MEKKTQKELRKDQDIDDLLKMVPEFINKILTGQDEELVFCPIELLEHKVYEMVYYIHFEDRHREQILKLCTDFHDLSPNLIDYRFGGPHDMKIIIMQ